MLQKKHSSHYRLMFLLPHFKEVGYQQLTSLFEPSSQLQSQHPNESTSPDYQMPIKVIKEYQSRLCVLQKACLFHLSSNKNDSVAKLNSCSQVHFQSIQPFGNLIITKIIKINVFLIIFYRFYIFYGERTFILHKQQMPSIVGHLSKFNSTFMSGISRLHINGKGLYISTQSAIYMRLRQQLLLFAIYFIIYHKILSRCKHLKKRKLYKKQLKTILQGKTLEISSMQYVIYSDIHKGSSKGDYLDLLPTNNIGQANWDYNKYNMQDQLAKTAPIAYTDAIPWDQSFLFRLHRQDDQDSWMRLYEKGQMLEWVQAEQNQVLFVSEGVNAYNASKIENSPQVITVATKGPSRSLFHNFQKNLVSLLKRVINVERKDLTKLPFGLGAYYLWKWFLDQGLKCKKSLYITFGVKFLKNQEFLTQVALKSPNLRKWLSGLQKNSIEEIQRLLRETVHRKASELERKIVQEISKVKDFQSFYSYFLIFLDELSEGALPMRMPKKQKAKHISL